MDPRTPLLLVTLSSLGSDTMDDCRLNDALAAVLIHVDVVGHMLVMIDDMMMVRWNMLVMID